MQHLKDEIKEAVKETPPLEARKQFIEEINERWFQETGQFIPPYWLDVLGNWLLRETLTDKNSYKAAEEEYPILSEHQLYRRAQRTYLSESDDELSRLNYHRNINHSARKKGANTKCQ